MCVCAVHPAVMFVPLLEREIHADTYIQLPLSSTDLPASPNTRVNTRCRCRSIFVSSMIPTLYTSLSQTSDLWPAWLDTAINGSVWQRCSVLLRATGDDATVCFQSRVSLCNNDVINQFIGRSQGLLVDPGLKKSVTFAGLTRLKGASE